MSDEVVYYRTLLREQRIRKLKHRTASKRDPHNQLLDDPLTPNDRTQRNLRALRGLLTTAFLYLLLFCAFGIVMSKIDNLPTRQGFFIQIVGKFLRQIL